MMLLALLLLSGSILTCRGDKWMGKTFSHQMELDTDGKVFLGWEIKGDEVTMELVVQTLGYAAVGFSPSGGMKGADIALGWVSDGDGAVVFKDMYAEGLMKPIEDASQDYELVDGSQNDTHTTLKFKRKMMTCDTDNDYALSDDTLRVIWAYSDTDDVTYHGAMRRGTKSVFLTSATQNPMDIEEFSNYKTWDVVHDNIPLPSDRDTMYWCKIFKVPKLDKKHQITGMSPLITPGNEGYVHHILFYECVLPQDILDDFEKFMDHEGAYCYSPNMPDEWGHCQGVASGWAVGGQGEVLPENVGFPLGAEYSGYDYYMLELHYDNPMMNKGVTDSSGIRLYYTDELRKYDGAMLTVGHRVFPLQIIPPKQPAYTTVGVCQSSCTNQIVPPEGIRAFSVILHSHIQGTAIRVRHFRNGEELPPLAVDDKYDFNYQEMRKIKPEVLILPGDVLLTECVYNTEGKESITVGGLSTRDEMCLAFISYYPKMDGYKCTSYVNPNDVANGMGAEFQDPDIFNHVETDNELGYALGTSKLGGMLTPYNLTLFEWAYGGVEWNQDVANHLQTITTTKGHLSDCRTGQEKRIKLQTTMSEPMPTTKLAEKYENEKKEEMKKKCQQKKKKTVKKTESPLQSAIRKRLFFRIRG